MKKILVIKRLSIFNIIIVMLCKFFRFEIYIFEFSGKTASWPLVKFLSLKKCNFEECININLSRYGGNIVDATEMITTEWIYKELFDNFVPFFTNVKDSNLKNRLLVREYVQHRCTSLNNICIWIDGYFVNQKKSNLNIYLLGDISSIEKKFLKIQHSDLRVKPIFSSDLFILFSLSLKFIRALFNKVSSIIARILSINNTQSNINQESFINNHINTFLYKILYFPHKSIFYGTQTLYVKDNFYSKDINSVFYPSSILHIESENINISEIQSKHYIDNNISTVIFPKAGIKKLSKCLIHILGEIGLKKTLFFLKKDVVLFFVFLINCIKFMSTKELIKENYSAKVVLVGYEILFPTILSLSFESLKIKTIAIQERFLPTFFPHYPFLVDTYLCNSDLVCKVIEKSNNKFVNNCIPCGQIRSDILIDYQENIVKKNNRFTIVAFDFHSVSDSDDNRLNVLNNWKANASFYKDLCKLAEKLPKVDIVIRGKDSEWTIIPFFKDVLNKVNRISNIRVDIDYSSPNKQYELAAKSDLVIAKYTSIGDEVIASGKRTIYYDYFPNSSHYFASEYYKYNNCNIFAYSYSHLEEMVQVVVNGGNFLTDKELLELQKITNNIPADGNVKNRVMENLDIIYNEACL
jgi:hypothetical protein